MAAEIERCLADANSTKDQLQKHGHIWLVLKRPVTFPVGDQINPIFRVCAVDFFSFVSAGCEGQNVGNRSPLQRVGCRPFFQECRRGSNSSLGLATDRVFLHTPFPLDKCPVAAAENFFLPLTSNRANAADPRFQKIYPRTLFGPEKRAYVVHLFREFDLESALLRSDLFRRAS
jgi:hypothetical protein